MMYYNREKTFKIFIDFCKYWFIKFLNLKINVVKRKKIYKIKTYC